MEIPAKGYKVTATVENMRYSGHTPINVIGIVGMQPLDKDKLRKTIFNYSDTDPKLTLTYMKNTAPQPQPNSIIVLNESSVIQLAFNIKGEMNGAAQQVFVADNQGDTPILLSPTVATIMGSSLQTFTLYRKEYPADKLLFDVRFKVEKES